MIAPPGEPVRLLPAGWCGEPRIEVQSGAGALIGFVPRSKIAAISFMEIESARLSRADPDPGPWKRYEVMVVGRHAGVEA